MKKILAIFLAIFLVATLGISTLAASTTLLSKDETWSSVDVSGETAQIIFNDDNTTTVKGSTAAWPCVISNLASPVTFTSADTFEFDFTFTTGTTSMLIFFGENGTTSDKYVVINSAITSNIVESNGDILPGTYTGSFNAADLAIPEGAANDDGSYTITGVKIFTCGGAEITFNTLAVTTAATETSDTASDDTSDSTPETGDAGLAIFAVLAAVSMVGALLVKKVR